MSKIINFCKDIFGTAKVVCTLALNQQNKTFETESTNTKKLAKKTTDRIFRKTQNILMKYKETQIVYHNFNNKISPCFKIVYNLLKMKAQKLF